MYLNSEMSTTDIALSISVSKATILKWMDLAGVERSNKAKLIGKKSTGKQHRLGIKATPEAIENMRRAQLARPPRAVGAKRSLDARRNMSEAAIRRWSEHPDREAHRQALVSASAASCKLDDAERVARNLARSALKRMLRRVLTMARKRKDRSTEEMLGYSKEQLRSHLESQFRLGMSWDNRKSFHIDHIVPVAHFFRIGITDPSVINALSNLQVLTPEENRLKSDSMEMSFAKSPRRQALIIDRDGTRAFA